MGALLPLIISIAPEIAKWLFGDSAERTTAAVSHAIQTVTGTSDAASQQSALERDPQMTTELRIQLAQLAAQAEADARKADLALLTAALADVGGARAQTIALVQARSAVAWGAPVVSLVVLTTFGVVMTLALTKSMPSGSETLLNMLLGTLAAMATSVVSYWVGSSAGSARKDDRLAQISAPMTGK